MDKSVASPRSYAASSATQSPTALPRKPPESAREYWARILPRVPSDDRRSRLTAWAHLLPEEQRRALVGGYLAWGSHLFYTSDSSSASALRYIYWGRVIAYRTPTKHTYPEVVPGLYIDEFDHVTAQSPNAPFPHPVRFGLKSLPPVPRRKKKKSKKSSVPVV